MIFYNITASMPVKPDWASISGDLKAGTPLSIGGKVSNDDGAFGLVQEDTAHGAEYVKVVYAGVADLSGASKSCGSAISDDAVQAMNGLTFIYGGKIYNVVPSGLPDSSEASQGDVLTIGSSGPEWDAPSGGGGGGVFEFTLTKSGSTVTKSKTDTEIAAAIDAGDTIIIYPIDGTTKRPPCIVYNASTSAGAVSTCFGQAHYANDTSGKLEIYSIGKLFAAGEWGIFLACNATAQFPMD